MPVTIVQINLMQIDRKLASKPPALRPRRPFKLPLGGFRFWLTVSAAGIIGSLALLLIQILLFARGLDRLPAGSVAGGVPVGGLTRAEARQRLEGVYLSPLALDYRGSILQLDPSMLGFRLDAETMIAQVPVGESSGSVWTDFWAYLWGSAPPAPPPVPLQAAYDQTRLADFLAEVATRYDDLGAPARPDPGRLSFIPGSAGYKVDRAEALKLIDAALRSPTDRAVKLPVNDFEQSPPTFDTLAQLLREDVRLFQFTGTVSIYLFDLKTGEELNIAMNHMQPVEAGEGIAYSGMSTIKIPVMVAFFRYKDGALTADEQLLLEGVFAESANPYTDLLLGILGQGSGLVGADIVSDTMQDLGLQNTFLAGLLDTLGAVTAPRRTPANSRPDINLNPDPFNQTSAADMGRLLAMIYQCSNGGGKLIANFGGQFTAEECQKMIALLRKNEVGPIFIAGGSPGATVAHKHGWDLLPLNNVGDAALVFSPGGDYAMTVYVHRDEPVPFDDGNRLIISLATAVFNYYNRSWP